MTQKNTSSKFRLLLIWPLVKSKRRQEILKLDEQLADSEGVWHKKCKEIPYAENILAINGVGENILAGILAEMGDISRFDGVKEIQKLSGMGR